MCVRMCSPISRTCCILQFQESELYTKLERSFSEGTIFLQELISSAGESFSPSCLASTGVYLGCMYTEYLDTVLAPQVSSSILRSQKIDKINYLLRFLRMYQCCAATS